MNGFEREKQSSAEAETGKRHEGQFMGIVAAKGRMRFCCCVGFGDQVTKDKDDVLSTSLLLNVLVGPSLIPLRFLSSVRVSWSEALHRNSGRLR